MKMKDVVLKGKSLLSALLLMAVTLTVSSTLLAACSEDDKTAQNLSETWMKATSTTVDIETGTRLPVTLIFKDATAEKLEYTCSSSDETIARATLSSDSKAVTIEGMAAGTANITVAYAAQSLENLTATIAVTVSEPDDDPEADYDGRWMKFDQETLEVNIDESAEVALTFSDDEVKGLEYEIRTFDTTVAEGTLNTESKVITIAGKEVGSTQVAVQYWVPLESGGSRIIRCLSDTVSVTVSDRLSGNALTLANAEMKLKPSETMDIAMAFGSTEFIEASNYTCTSTDENVASAEVVKEDDGDFVLKLTAKAAGETSIAIEHIKSGRKNMALSGEITIKVIEGLTRVLAIGNSFSQDAVEQYLYDLAKAAGHDLVIGNMFIGGCSLDTHWEHMQNDDAAYSYRKIDSRVEDGAKQTTADYKLSQALADEKWDYISLQQVSGNSGQYSTYTNLPNLIAGVKEVRSDAKIIFHQTWAYAEGSNHSDFDNYGSDQMTMYNAIMEAVQQAVKDNPEIKLVIPSGTAIQNGRTSYLDDTFCRDTYHLEVNYGRYTAACTWFEAIFDENVVDNTYKPDAVDDNQAKIARYSARAAVANPYEVTDMSDYDPPVNFTNPVYVDFGSTKSDTPWNNVTTAAATTPVILSDTGGTSTGLKLKVSGFTNYSNTSVQYDVTLYDVEFPKAVWGDALMVSDETKGYVTISRLDPAKKYDFMVLSTRYNGSTAARITSISLNDGEVKTINQGVPTSEPNKPTTNHIATFTGIAPTTDGLVVITISAGGSSNEGHISALVITPQSQSE